MEKLKEFKKISYTVKVGIVEKVPLIEGS